MPDNWHEDFGDEPSVEERYPDDQAPEDFFDDEYDAELAADQILERQELEDFEGLGWENEIEYGEG